jgi:rSAM/selenodomain-associated transferase 1
MKAIRTVIFAKAPLPGLVKTRLIPALGEEGAATLAGKLLEHCISEALTADLGPVELCVAPTARHPIWQELGIPSAVSWSEQGDGDLGERLARAAQRVTARDEAVLLIGTDCPGLTAEKMRVAAQRLVNHRACMVPVSDGGYALLGLHQYHPTLFFDMPWSTAKVAYLTRMRLLEQGVFLQELSPLNDIDEPSDLQYLPEHLKPLMPERDASPLIKYVEQIFSN